MTVFPDSIRIRVVNADTVNPVQNVVVNLMLFANHKNNYGFALPVTNVAGITEISKEWLSTRVDEYIISLSWIIHRGLMIANHVLRSKCMIKR